MANARYSIQENTNCKSLFMFYNMYFKILFSNNQNTDDAIQLCNTINEDKIDNLL